MAKFLGKKLLVDGYVYLRSQQAKGRTYWDCNRLRAKECDARAITTGDSDETLVVLQGPAQKPHPHPPDVEECSAEKVKFSIKRKAEEHPEEPPARILRSELSGLSSDVHSHLPDRENLKKSIRRLRRKNWPPNPTSIDALGEIPERFTKTSMDEHFLLYDSQDNAARVIVFSTRKNLEILLRSYIWFLDGTFKVSPNIFTQVFTVLGVVRRETRDADDEVTRTEVYALLSSKEESQYIAVLSAILESATNFNIQCKPEVIMTDFEMAIINSCEEIFPDARIACCFFHLGQSLYRKVQELGFSEAYNDEKDRSFKKFAMMLLGLAFVPVTDVPSVMRSLKKSAPNSLQALYRYFDETYVSGKTRASPPRYPIKLWNQFVATQEGTHRTNNISEG
ncbi:hypothetical protein TKK_0007815 [Trichogramma kaykai]